MLNCFWVPITYTVKAARRIHRVIRHRPRVHAASVGASAAGASALRVTVRILVCVGGPLIVPPVAPAVPAPAPPAPPPVYSAPLPSDLMPREFISPYLLSPGPLITPSIVEKYPTYIVPTTPGGGTPSNPVPEPASILVLLTGLLFLAVIRRRSF